MAAEVSKRRSTAAPKAKAKQQSGQEPAAQVQQQQQQGASSGGSGKADLKFLVASLKRKTAAKQGSSSKPAQAGTAGAVKPKKKQRT